MAWEQFVQLLSVNAVLHKHKHINATSAESSSESAPTCWSQTRSNRHFYWMCFLVTEHLIRVIDSGIKNTDCGGTVWEKV